MSKQPDMSWGAIGALWGFAGAVFLFLWVVGYFGDDEPKIDKGPVTLVTQLGQGSSFMCTTERNIMRLEDAIATRNKEKLDLVFEQGCISAEPNVAVTFISGSISNNTMNVIYQGKSLWAYGDTVGYQTDAHRAVQQAFIDCEYGDPCQQPAYDALQEANRNQ